MEQLTSIHNQHVKDWKKLQTKKARRQTGTYLLDGWHLVQEASKAGIELLEVVGTAEQLAAHCMEHGFSSTGFKIQETWGQWCGQQMPLDLLE